MKYNSMITALLTSAFISLCFLISHQALAADTSDVEKERWFEIEVILFKQLTKKSNDTEQFLAHDLRDKKQRAIDLLSPYIQPDIASLKQLLPRCGEQAPKLPYSINLRPNTQWFEKIDFYNDKANKLSAVKINSNKELPVYTQYPSNSHRPLCVIPAETIKKNLTAKQLEMFNIDGFPVEKLTTTINGLEQWQEDAKGNIIWASQNPYLISQDSLQLKSIINRLKRSRYFAPLLHVGWRQVGESKKQAQAIRLFAGENLALDYQQAIAKKRAEHKLTEQTIDNSLIDNIAAVSETSRKEQNRQQAKQRQLNKLFEQLDLFTDIKNIHLEANSLEEHNAEESNPKSPTVQSDSTTSENSTTETRYSKADKEKIEKIIAELSFDMTNKGDPLKVNSTSDIELAIKTPLQPWYLDGLFKVHLDHYLYINSEFNILAQAKEPTRLTPNQAVEDKNHVVYFKQDRRVITGEIHYFDHPSIGMIVQIRRFDPTKPAIDAVTQAKKS
ncbi:MAG: CsiV family protein [Colwellia sp.]